MRHDHSPQRADTTAALRKELEALLIEGAPGSVREAYPGGGVGGGDRLTAPRVRFPLGAATRWTWFDGEFLRTESLARGDALVLHRLATVRQESGSPEFLEVSYFEGVVSLDRELFDGERTRRVHAPLALSPALPAASQLKQSLDAFLHYRGRHLRGEARRCLLRLGLIQLQDLFLESGAATASDAKTDPANEPGGAPGAGGEPRTEVRRSGGIGLSVKAALFNYVFQHCRRELPRTELAEALGVSDDYVNTLCRRTFGRTFTQLLLLARLLTAREHVEGSRHAVAEVGRMCGFRNTAHFIKRYRERFERTPLQMRKEFQGLGRASRADLEQYQRAAGFGLLAATVGLTQAEIPIAERRPAAVLFGSAETVEDLRVMSLEPDGRESLFCDLPPRSHNYCFAYAGKVWVVRNTTGEERGRYRLPSGDGLIVPGPQAPTV